MLVSSGLLCAACTGADETDSPSTSAGQADSPAQVPAVVDGLPGCDVLDLAGIGDVLGAELAEAPTAPGLTECSDQQGRLVRLTDAGSASAASALVDGATGQAIDGLADQALLDEQSGSLVVQSESLVVEVIAPGADGNALVGAFELVTADL